MVANNRENGHAGGAHGLAHLTLKGGTVAAIILHIVAHAQGIDVLGGRPFGQQRVHVAQRLILETLQVGLFPAVVVGPGVVRIHRGGYLRVAKHHQSVTALAAQRESAKGEIVGRVALDKRLIEARGAVGRRMDGHLTVVGNGVINEARPGVAAQAIMPHGVGERAGETVAHNNAGHAIALGVGQRSHDDRVGPYADHLHAIALGF